MDSSTKSKQRALISGAQANRPYLRRMVVELGPLEEWRGQQRGEVVSFASNGTMNGLRITAQLHTTIMSIPTPSVIAIYNLAEDTRNAIKRSLTRVALKAGWDNTDLVQIFQGSLMSVWSERQGPDIVTKMTVIPGYGSMVRGVTSISFTQGMPVKEAAKRIAKNFPGLTVSEGNILGVNNTIGAQGFAGAGSTKDVLTALGDEYGFSWSIDNGEVRIIADKFQLGEYVELGGDNSGIINISPLTMGPLQMPVGVQIKAMYVPGVRAGRTIKINPTLNPQFTGQYRCHQVDMNLDAYSDSWSMDIQSYNYRVG